MLRVHVAITLAAATALLSAQPGAGIELRSGAAVSGRVVELPSRHVVPEALVSMGDNRWTPAATTKTDHEGRFVFRGLSLPTVELWASKGGYVGGRYGQRSATSPSTSLTITPDETVAGIELALWKQAIITGQVRDDAGDPIVGAFVVPLVREWVTGMARLGVARSGGPVRTDDEGVYRLVGLAPGSYAVAVASSDAAFRYARLEASAMARPTIFFPGSMSSADASILRVEAADIRAGIDFTIFPVNSQTISGRIAGGRGDTEWTIELQTNSTGPATVLDVRTSQVDPDGRFSFSAVPIGLHTVRAYAFPGRGNFRVVGGIPTLAFRPGEPFPPVPPGPTLWAEASIVVGPDPVEPVLLQPTEGARIRGRIVFDSANKAPPVEILRSSAVSALPADGRNLTGETAAPLGVDASFTTAGLPRGCYWLTLRFPASGWMPASISVSGQPAESRCIEVGATDVANVVLTLTDQPTRVSGTVRDRQERVQPLTAVLVFPVDATRWTTSPMFSALRHTWTSRYATYEFLGLPQGEYAIVAIEGDVPSDWRDPAVLARLAASAVRVHLADRGTLRQDLTVASVQHQLPR